MEEYSVPTLVRYTTTKYATSSSKRKCKYGIYKCQCGAEFEARVESIASKNTKSCGCYNRAKVVERNTSHGLSCHPLYKIWQGMLSRTRYSKNKAYATYGGRGISVCEQWLDFSAFYNDMIDGYDESLSIDRIKNDLGYSKENCRWATREIQSSNTSRIRANNTSGYRGVSFDSSSGLWKARVGVNKKMIHLGRYSSPVDAARAYDDYVVSNSLPHTINGVAK